MTPFKTKVLVTQYQSMGYELKVKDVLYRKKKDGNFAQYVELIGLDEINKIWLGKSATMRSLPVSIIDAYIDIVVVPFEQYTTKMKQKGFSILKK